jgi:hypothetical protein
LQEETEQLARFVRAYTSTGEARYLFYYYDILSIRMGEKPAPLAFHPTTYWDAVVAGRIHHALPAEGKRESLFDRMQGLDFEPRELQALTRILTATDAMKQVEQVAFAATQGLSACRPTKSAIYFRNSPKQTARPRANTAVRGWR